MKSKPPPRQPAKPARPDANPPGQSSHPWWQHGVVILCLLLASLGLYGRTLGLGFLSVDDPDYIQNNPLLGNLSAANLKRILTEPYFANYAPANILSYAMDIALAGGKSPFAIHLSNVLWNGWAVCMVYLLAFTLRAEILTAAAAAFLFLLHPAHVEVVAWISCRKDLIATAFGVLSMTCYLLCRKPIERRSWWYAASVASFLLASAGKQSISLLPFIMLVWDFLVERRLNWQAFLDKIPFGLITLFFGFMTAHAQPSTNHAWSPLVPVITEFTNLWLLSGLGDYVLYRVAPDPAAWSLPAKIALCLVALLVWALPLVLLFLSTSAVQNRSDPKPRRARQAPIRSTSPERGGTRGPQPGPVGMSPRERSGAAFRFVAIVLGYWILVHMVPPMLLNFMVPITDRYLFLPSVAVCILLACVAAELGTRWPRTRWLGWTALTCIAAIWGAKTSSYINEWRDPRTIWYGAHFKTASPQVAQFLGEVYQNAGEHVDDFLKSGAPLQLTNEVAFARAVLGDPVPTELLRGEWQNAAPTRTNSLAYREQLWSLAREQFDQALARRGSLSTPNLFMNRGRLFVRQGRPEEAIREFQAALALAQASSYELVRQETVTHALFAIGVAHWNLHNYKEAEQWLLKAQETQRKSGRAWVPALDREVERIKSLATGPQSNP